MKTAEKAKACLVAAATLALATTLLSHTSSAQQDGCGASQVAQSNLRLLRAAEDKGRIIAANSLTNQWATTLPTVMLELRGFAGAAASWSNEQQVYFLSLTDVLRSMLANNVRAIAQFRACDDPAIIRPLVWAARGQNQSIRVNATLILGNVVDNTTVCFVLHHLLDPSISLNGRANLLGVVVAMASYAYKENVAAIERMLTAIEQKIANETGDLSQTKRLVADLRARVSTSPNSGSSLPPDLRTPCADYDYRAQVG
jgi:hypothetical protein